MHGSAAQALKKQLLHAGNASLAEKQQYIQQRRKQDSNRPVLAGSVISHPAGNNRLPLVAEAPA
jgi:hypothetical protein